jgi:hypothetical protein
MVKRNRSVLVVIAVTVALLSVVPTAASASKERERRERPTVEGPIIGGNGIFLVGSTLFDLGVVGYRQDEFFLSGTATSFASSNPLLPSGAWDVEPAVKAPYKTRMVVYRPVDPHKFNGTVVVEWLNISGGIDAAAVWLSGHDQLIREGAAFIGVTAQAGGINGVASSVGAIAGFSGGLKKIDPARYSTLNHPGDSFSYDIFTQTGEALRRNSSMILSGLQPKTVLAVGESQSAIRLTTYLDAVGPSTHVWDAYLVYSRGAAGAALSQAPQEAIASPTPTRIRTDLRQPVLIFTTETDLMVLGYVQARQPDTRRIRNWEVAGTAHDDTYGLVISRTDTGAEAADIAAFQTMISPPASAIPGIIDCAVPINAGSHTYELRAALVALERWARDDDAVPRGSPRLDVDRKNGAFVFELDANGNVEGGIRTPQIEAPIAKLSGLGQPPGGTFCRIFGTTVPFSASRLRELYPTHAAFVTAWNKAVDRQVRLGFILAADATRLKDAAARSTIPG